MNLIGVLSYLSLLLAASAAQNPKPCVSPPLMTGGFSVVSHGVVATGTVSYDALGQKLRLRTFGLTSNETFAMDQLMLFRKEVYYEINWATHSCRKKPLYSSFMPMQVPSDAQMTGQVILGSSSSWGMGLLVNNWSGFLPHNTSYTMVFTDVGCIPMTFAGFGSGYESTFLSTFNWVLGISDPADLLVPTACAKAKLEDTDAPHTFFTALASLAAKTKRSD